MILLNCSVMLGFSFDELAEGFHIQALAGANKVNVDIKTCCNVGLFCSHLLDFKYIAHFKKRLVYTIATY
jgi:hypothetical protein